VFAMDLIGLNGPLLSENDTPSLRGMAVFSLCQVRTAFVNYPSENQGSRLAAMRDHHEVSTSLLLRVGKPPFLASTPVLDSRRMGQHSFVRSIVVCTLDASSYSEICDD